MYQVPAFPLAATIWRHFDHFCTLKQAVLLWKKSKQAFCQKSWCSWREANSRPYVFLYSKTKKAWHANHYTTATLTEELWKFCQVMKILNCSQIQLSRSLHQYLFLKKDFKAQNKSGQKCRDPGSNRGPLDLQSNALPTELSRHLTINGNLNFVR